MRKIFEEAFRKCWKPWNQEKNLLLRKLPVKSKFCPFLSNFWTKTEIFVEILNQNFIIFSVIFTRKSKHHNVLSATCSNLVVIPLKMKFCSKIDFFEKNFRYAILIPHFILSRTIICVGGNFSFLIKNF